MPHTLKKDLHTLDVVPDAASHRLATARRKRPRRPDASPPPAGLPTRGALIIGATNSRFYVIAPVGQAAASCRARIRLPQAKQPETYRMRLVPKAPR